MKSNQNQSRQEYTEKNIFTDNADQNRDSKQLNYDKKPENILSDTFNSKEETMLRKLYKSTKKQADDCFETYNKHSIEHVQPKCRISKREYSTESSPALKKSLRPIVRNDYCMRSYKKWSKRNPHWLLTSNAKKDKAGISKSNSCVNMIKKNKVNSFIIPSVRLDRKQSKDKDDGMTNEIESQCPQMMALFGSQVCTEEEISQIRIDKSEELSEEPVVIDEDTVPMIQKETDEELNTPTLKKSLSRLSRNQTGYPIPSKAITLGYGKDERNHERAFMDKLKTTECPKRYKNISEKQ
ncbi:unnamed protein product [Moneuplotes crassus]|uniref:Uncharacterized protein n=1 Tax=Euplotes crassus TaxID=5936 RepID=A0AAD1X972_EUPCR|nr:unnamed protein product [Moneuplotes crassus]